MLQCSAVQRAYLTPYMLPVNTSVMKCCNAVPVQTAHLNSSMSPLKTSVMRRCRAGALDASVGPSSPKELNTSSRNTPQRACKSSFWARTRGCSSSSGLGPGNRDVCCSHLSSSAVKDASSAQVGWLKGACASSFCCYHQKELII